MSFQIFNHYIPLNWWKTSGDFCQSKWESLLEIIGEDPFHHTVTYMIIIAIITHVLIGGIFTIMDVTNKPKFLRKYKVQPGTNEPINTEKLMKVITTVIFNQTIVTYLHTWLLFSIMTKFQQNLSIKVLPSLSTIILSFMFFILVREPLFYYSHRLLHTKYLYKRIHKKHHEWTASISIVATYCHPIEHVLSNLLPICAGPGILQAHVVTTSIWIIYSIAETLIVHSGYHLPLFTSPEFHDYHHLKFNQNYGAIGLCDWLHKTDLGFRNDVPFKRNYRMFNLKSVREAIPDKCA